MAVIGWIFFGFFVGVIAKLIMPGRDPGGFIVTVAIGIAGALIGGWLGHAAGLYHDNQPVGFVMAVIGSLVLLALYHMLFRSERTA